MNQLLGRTPIALQLLFALCYVGGYILWSRAYYRVVDPRIRRRLGSFLDADIIWVHRKGDPSGGWSFRLLYDTWSWGIRRDGSGSLLKDGAVYVLGVIVVMVICGLWPFALFLAVFLGTDFLSVLVALPLLFLTIPIYSIYWSGRYEVEGMQRHGQP